MTNSRLVMLCVSALSYVLILVTLPFRVKSILKSAGKKVLSVEKRNAVLQILILICCALMIGLLVFRDLGTCGDLIICCVSILGTALGSEELGLNGKCGVYENGIIGSGHFLPLKEIFALPILSYSREEQEIHDPSALRVITDKKGTVTFVYANKAERDLVLQKLIEISPRLAVDTK